MLFVLSVITAYITPATEINKLRGIEMGQGDRSLVPPFIGNGPLNLPRLI